MPTAAQASEAASNNDAHRLPVRHNLPVQRRHSRHRDEAPALGNLQLQLEPPVDVLLNNVHVSLGNVRLRTTTGSLQIGAASDPFVVHIRYRVDTHGVTYDVRSEPWASVSGPGGIPLGRTPVQNISGTTVTVFELHNPKVPTNQRISIRFSPP